MISGIIDNNNKGGNLCKKLSGEVFATIDACLFLLVSTSSSGFPAAAGRHHQSRKSLSITTQINSHLRQQASRGGALGPLFPIERQATGNQF